MPSKKTSRGRTPDGSPNPIDIHVGHRLRTRRQMMGLSQEKLAALLGLTFQQVQKYERGMNRIGCSRLWDIANILGVDINFFFAEIDEQTNSQSPRNQVLTPELLSELEIAQVIPVDPLHRQEAMELVNAYYKINNREVAEQFRELIIKIGKTTWNHEAKES